MYKCRHLDLILLTSIIPDCHSRYYTHQGPKFKCWYGNPFTFRNVIFMLSLVVIPTRCEFSHLYQSLRGAHLEIEERIYSSCILASTSPDRSSGQISQKLQRLAIGIKLPSLPTTKAPSISYFRSIQIRCPNSFGSS